MSASKMPLVYNDPKHWQTRAVEARTIAERMLDPEGRRSMLTVAEQYERIAERAVERLKALAQGRPPIVHDTEDAE